MLTDPALVAVPPLAALALATVVRGGQASTCPAGRCRSSPSPGRPRGSLGGQTAALALSALACVSLGWLLACVVPARWLKLGIYAMAVIDAWLVGANLLQGPNAVLNAASPAADLPQPPFLSLFRLRRVGFGDAFIAAVLGALLASNRRLQLTGAALAAAFGISFDFLFFALDSLPATVPIAITLAVLELALGRGSPYLDLGQDRRQNTAIIHARKGPDRKAKLIARPIESSAMASKPPEFLIDTVELCVDAVEPSVDPERSAYRPRQNVCRLRQSRRSIRSR